MIKLTGSAIPLGCEFCKAPTASPDSFCSQKCSALHFSENIDNKIAKNESEIEQNDKRSTVQHKHQKNIWINEYKFGLDRNFYTSKEMADFNKSSNRIRCVKFVEEVSEDKISTKQEGIT